MSLRNHDTVPVEIGLADIEDAARRLEPWIHRTPVLTSRTLDERSGLSVFLKCENFQRVGAFKFRGAMNALLQLDEDRKFHGVVTHSSGNHAQALALAGKLLGVPVTIVMPRTAPAVKKAATAGYGARIVLCEPTLAAREAAVAAEIEAHQLTLVHPYNDWNVIAGQGTAALELLDQVGRLDAVIAPVGGGGLASGTALVAKGRAPAIHVLGAEPSVADDARRSLEAGTIQPSGDPKTIADGLRTSLGTRTFAVISRHVDEIVTATDDELIEATRFVWERLKIVIEPSSAVVVAPLLRGNLSVPGERVGIILSGGNVDVGPFFDSLSGRH
ncbi:pyridoxal-phosphate dependent enzyme [Aquisphaera insulae]|uniref:pyridoxal-phosphate dependent enzyme n=1 Tax=Aquisphaera insulae TaxID=2712864 RepID=UPI0013E9EF01|nr:pyridoxal-phosphate dependent enzyme [Aquisphaera insulae]